MASDTPAARPPAPGAALLRDYLARHGITQDAASKAIRVTNPAVNDWVNGKKRPEPHHRTAIATFTNGEVPVDSWLRENELAQVASVVPFVPAADESGEHPAVDVAPSRAG